MALGVRVGFLAIVRRCWLSEPTVNDGQGADVRGKLKGKELVPGRRSFAAEGRKGSRGGRQRAASVKAWHASLPHRWSPVPSSQPGFSVLYFFHRISEEGITWFRSLNSIWNSKILILNFKFCVLKTEAWPPEGAASVSTEGRMCNRGKHSMEGCRDFSKFRVRI